MKIGYFLSSEEWGPKELVANAVKAQEAGFEGYWISDHFHPWHDGQGHSPFVWSVIGAVAVAAPGMPLTTAVTCPTVRIHPAVIAHAAATAAVLLDGRFTLGVGTGEALNEHILGDRWPSAPGRREMLEEAVEIIRELWAGGVKSHRGRHYQVDHARIYDLPAEPPKIVVSGFGPAAVELAAKIGDGFCTVEPEADAVERFRSQARRGRLVQGGIKVCFDSDERRARETAYRLWPNDGLPGELAQILPTPSHFEQAVELVSEETVTEQVPCGPDIEQHIAAIRAYEEAGFDELYVQQIGPNQDEFFAAYREHVLPEFGVDRQLASARR
ncbi:MAG TPA: TIGR03557 family F420-dependent LLM class oxidoreductase [Solirubrobacteraceae bacterium]|jgi:G6PDH family F420-dependent oxidoreductase|nr:TIGR03557 family F420-dependent LLM class oxidoreductase [Solirubrobacteraceae bacterium]